MTKLNQTIINLLENLELGDWRPLLSAHADALVRNLNVLEYFRLIKPLMLEALDSNQTAVIRGDFLESPIFTAVSKGEHKVISDIANILLHNYILCKTIGGQDVFRVVDHERMIVELYCEHKLLMSNLVQAINDECRHRFGQTIDTSCAKKIADTWFHSTIRCPMPVPMARDNEKVWCLHRPTVIPNSSVKFPSWGKLLARMSDPKPFAAWIAGVYTGRYKGRMVLWLYGPNGEDGKSTIANIIGRSLFGPAYTAISDAVLKGNKSFINSFFAGAELICYGDASNTKVLGTEEFKTLASHGADLVLIERKHKHPYFAKLTARVWVNSNFMPEVENSNFATSRLLLIEIEKMTHETPDPKAIERLTGELPGFLAHAIECYEELCPDDYKIAVSSTTTKLIESCIHRSEQNFEEIFDKHWEYSPNESDKIESIVCSRILHQEGILSTKEQAKFYEWAQEHRNVIKRKVSSLGGKSFLFYIKRKNEDSIDVKSLLNFKG